MVLVFESEGCGGSGVGGGGGGDIFRDLTEMGRMGEVSSKSRALTAGKVLRFYIFPFLSFYPKQHALAFPRVSK